MIPRDSVVRVVSGGRNKVNLARHSGTQIAMAQPEFAALAPLRNERCPCMYSYRVRSMNEQRFRYYLMGVLAFESIPTLGRVAGYDAARSHAGEGVAVAEARHGLWDPAHDADFPVLLVEHAGAPGAPPLRVEYDARFETAQEHSAEPGWALALGPAVHAAVYARLECPAGSGLRVSLGGAAGPSVGCGEAAVLTLEEWAGAGRLVLSPLLFEPTVFEARSEEGLVAIRASHLAPWGRPPPPPPALAALVGERECAPYRARALPEESGGGYQLLCEPSGPPRDFEDVVVSRGRAASRTSGAFAMDYKGNPFAQVGGEESARKEAMADAWEWGARGRPPFESRGLLAPGSAVIYERATEAFVVAGGWGFPGTDARLVSEAAAADLDAQARTTKSQRGARPSLKPKAHLKP
eukprot:tig00000076_g2462.t1